MANQSGPSPERPQHRDVTELREPVFKQLFNGVPLSTVPWIWDSSAIPVGSTGYLDSMGVDLFGGSYGSAPMCCGKDAYDRNFVSFHLQIETSEPVGAGQTPEFSSGARQRHIFTVFERYLANREFLVICVSHRSLDQCCNSRSLLFQLLGIGSLQVTESAMQKLNGILMALHESGVWKKRDLLRDVDWTHPQKNQDLEVVTKVTFCCDVSDSS